MVSRLMTVTWKETVVALPERFCELTVVFFTSYGMIHYANKNIEPSLQQEATALLALISCIASLLWAVTLQLLSIAAKTHLFERD